MSSFSKIKLKSFAFAFVLGLLLSIIIYFIIEFFFNSSFNSLSQFFILISILTSVSFFCIHLYLKFFIENKIKEIYNSVIPQNDVISSNLISTNMEDLINQLKTYSQESQTEIKSMQEKENFRRNFIGNLAHELKTPLFTSQSYLLTLIDGALKDENVNLKYLKIAEKAVERLIFIVKDLDLITKLESDNMKLEKSKFNLISIINNVFEMLEIQANKKKHLLVN
jgi:two-component system phosphate regulon sensor histidine kinase PhoR